MNIQRSFDSCVDKSNGNHELFVIEVHKEFGYEPLKNAAFAMWDRLYGRNKKE